MPFRPEPHDSDDPTICYCMDVPRSSIVAAIDSGSRTVTDLQDTTGACTGCGTCRLDLLALLAANSEHTTPGPGRRGPSDST